MPKLIVLQRIYPDAAMLPAAVQLKDDWFAVLRQFPQCKQVDLICCVEGQLAWLEYWDSKKSYEECINQKLGLGLTDFPARMMECSQRPISRDFYHYAQRYHD